MAPDLNTLPPSRSTSSSPHQTRNVPSTASPDIPGREAPSPSRSTSTSLAAAASINAADLSRHPSTGSPRIGRAHERRRSAVAMNLNLNDPTLPSPGELASSDHRSSITNAFRTTSPTMLGGTPAIATGDPHHQRTPSLGEIHQELEQEQEAQVNRLLTQIRVQQAQLQQMQVNHQQYVHTHGNTSPSPLAPSTQPFPSHPHLSTASSIAVDDSTPTSEQSCSLANATTAPVSIPNPTTTSSIASPSPALRPLPRTSTSFLHQQNQYANHDSSHSSFDSPSSPSAEIPNIHPGLARRTSRDETAFYQAETATLTRENQMLRLRIRELERMLAEGGSASRGRNNPSQERRSSGNGNASPVHIHSGLTREFSSNEGGEEAAGPAAALKT